MDTETVLAHMLTSVEEIIKTWIGQVVESSTPATLYNLEEQT